MQIRCQIHNLKYGNTKNILRREFRNLIKKERRQS